MTPTDDSRIIPLPGGGQATATVALEDRGSKQRDPRSSILDLRSGLAWALMFLVVALAFLVGSAPARNSDLWLHLASGRLLASGQYRFGVDPFTYTGAGVYWVNHSWLYDLLSYTAFRVVGGAGLVVLKALLLALLAVVLLRAGAARLAAPTGRWIAAVCAALAVIALGPWTALQPVCVSYLFLGLTVLFLERPRHTGTDGAVPLWAYWPLLPLFALWANLDAWFVLGPLTVALYLLGGLLHRGPAGNARPQAAALGVALALGLLACLLNPAGVRVFTLPPQLGLDASIDPLRQDVALGGPFVSPLQPVFYRTSLGQSAAPIAAGLLLVLGLLSFALNGRAWNGPRLLVWLGFALLGAWHVYAIPFFAIVAAPIVALNLQEWARRTTVARAFLPVSGRVLALVGLLGVLVAAWPGWLQGRPYEVRGWAAEPDPSLERAALQIRDWRKDGRLAPDARGFNFATYSANTFAWLCPEEKGFFDSRLFGDAATVADFVALRRALLEEVGPPEAAPADRPATPWRQILRDRKINHVIVDDTNPLLRDAVVRRLLAAPGEWPLLDRGGRTFIFGWRDPEQANGPDPFAGLRLNPERRGYHPGPEEMAPQDWPGREPEEKVWWSTFRPPAALWSYDRDEAAACLLAFEALRPEHARRNEARWATFWKTSRAAGLVAAPPLPMGGASPAAFACGLNGQLLATTAPAASSRQPFAALALNARSAFMMYQDDSAAGLLFQAVRAARRALNVNPEDAAAWAALGEAYAHLMRSTQERGWNRFFPFLTRLRQVQAITALENALRLQPELETPRLLLYTLYQELGYLDCALEHLKQNLKYMRVRGKRSSQTPEQFDEQVAQYQKQIDELEKAAQDVRDLFEVNASNLRVFDRAQLAYSKGLARLALDTLLASDASAFGAEGSRLELDLLLTTGRVKDVREWLDPDHKSMLGDFFYDWTRTQMYAAMGAYAEADQVLAELIDHDATRNTKAALMLARTILTARLTNRDFGYRLWAVTEQADTFDKFRRLGETLPGEANLTVVRGLLALEAGRTPEAKRHLNQALLLWRGSENVPGSGMDFPARILAERYLEALSRP